MITYLAKMIVHNWKKKKIITEEKSEAYQYGIELNISSAISIFLILTCGVLLFSLADSIIFLSIFILVRLYTGGYHAESYFTCNLSMLITYSTTAYCAQIVKLKYDMILIFLILSFIVFVLCCPVNNKYKLLNTFQKKKCKLISLALHIIVSIICLFLYYNNIYHYKMIFFTIMAITLLILIGNIKNYIERRRQ